MIWCGQRQLGLRHFIRWEPWRKRKVEEMWNTFIMSTLLAGQFHPLWTIWDRRMYSGGTCPCSVHVLAQGDLQPAPHKTPANRPPFIHFSSFHLRSMQRKLQIFSRVHSPPLGVGHKAEQMDGVTPAHFSAALRESACSVSVCSRGDVMLSCQHIKGFIVRTKKNW